MKKIIIMLMTIIISLFITGCSFIDEDNSYSGEQIDEKKDSIEDNSYSGEQIDEKKDSIYDKLSHVTFKCDEWTFFDLYFSNYFIERANSENVDYVKLRLRSFSPYINVEYNNIEVRVTFYWERKGLHHESETFAWPSYENGSLEKIHDFYSKYTRYAVKKTTYSATGYVKYDLKCYKDEFGFLYTRVGATNFSYDDIKENWNFVGISFEPNNRTVKLPSDIYGDEIDRFGFCVFDLIGFESVENLIVPKNYKYYYLDNWKSIQNLKNIYFEGTSIQNIYNTRGGFNVNQYYYSSEEPQENKERYWHYIDDTPTPWSID